jgi:hypothetical protein
MRVLLPLTESVILYTTENDSLEKFRHTHQRPVWAQLLLVEVSN